MRWDELTGDLFSEAAQKAEDVCLLPLSCIERHGHHLPLATDVLITTAEKGNFSLDARARGLAKSIRAIKDDTETKRLQDEFFEKIYKSDRL